MKKELLKKLKELQDLLREEYPAYHHQGFDVWSLYWRLVDTIEDK